MKSNNFEGVAFAGANSIVAVGTTEGISPYDVLWKLIPSLQLSIVCPEPSCPPPCPVSDCRSDHGRIRAPIAGVVMHLNDDHYWTREVIADWLESLDVDTTFPNPEGIQNDN